MIELGYNETNLEEYLTADPIQEVYNEVSGSLTPHLPLWLTVLTSIFLVMTFLVLVCVIWDNHRKRRARHERDVNRERFVQASRLRNFDTDNPQFVNLMRLLWDGPLAHKQIDSINFPMLTIDSLVSIQFKACNYQIVTMTTVYYLNGMMTKKGETAVKCYYTVSDTYCKKLLYKQ